MCHYTIGKSVSAVTKVRANNLTIRVRFPAGAENCLHRCI